MSNQIGNQSTQWILTELFSGGVAGSVGILIGNPLDIVKVRIQTMHGKYKSSLDCIKLILKNEGPSGFFKGLSSPLFAQFFINALSFCGSSATMKILEPRLRKGEAGSPMNVLISGSVGGFLSCLILTPADLVKCKMQVDEAIVGSNKYSGTIQCFKNILKVEGIPGLYKGFVITALREVPSFAIYYSSYKYISVALTPKQSTPSTTITLFSGGVAGCFSWFLTYPIDVIKSRIQTSTAVSTNNPQLYQVCLTLFRTQGIKGFYTGLGVALVRAFPVNAVTFYCYEKLTDALHLSSPSMT